MMGNSRRNLDAFRDLASEVEHFSAPSAGQRHPRFDSGSESHRGCRVHAHQNDPLGH